MRGSPVRCLGCFSTAHINVATKAGVIGMMVGYIIVDAIETWKSRMTDDEITDPAPPENRVHIGARIDATDANRLGDELERRREEVKAVPFALLPTLADVVRDVIRLGLDALDARRRAREEAAQAKAEKEAARTATRKAKKR